MAKNHRVEIRLGEEEDYQTLLARAEQFDDTMTGAIEHLLRMAVPVAICGVRAVGSQGRRRFSVRFSSGMVVHGFLWSQRRQLLGPRIQVHTPAGLRWRRIVDGSRDFWRTLRALCVKEFVGESQEIELEELAPHEEPA